MRYCQACQREAPTKYVEYYQNIGMLVMRQLRSVKGHLCRRCTKHYFLKMTGLTLLTGWWGMISFIMNPFLIINNVIRYLTCLGLADAAPNAFPVQPAAGPSAGPGAPPVLPTGLAAYRSDVQMRLRGGEDPKAIAFYLSERVGVPLGQAQAYVTELARISGMASGR